MEGGGIGVPDRSRAKGSKAIVSELSDTYSSVTSVCEPGLRSTPCLETRWPRVPGPAGPKQLEYFLASAPYGATIAAKCRVGNIIGKSSKIIDFHRKAITNY